jgi:hypothetical protein
MRGAVPPGAALLPASRVPQVMIRPLVSLVFTRSSAVCSRATHSIICLLTVFLCCNTVCQHGPHSKGVDSLTLSHWLCLSVSLSLSLSLCGSSRVSASSALSYTPASHLCPSATSGALHHKHTNTAQQHSLQLLAHSPPPSLATNEHSSPLTTTTQRIASLHKM